MILIIIKRTSIKKNPVLFVPNSQTLYCSSKWLTSFVDIVCSDEGLFSGNQPEAYPHSIRMHAGETGSAIQCQPQIHSNVWTAQQRHQQGQCRYRLSTCKSTWLHNGRFDWEIDFAPPGRVLICCLSSCLYYSSPAVGGGCYSFRLCNWRYPRNTFNNTQNADP